MLRLIDGSGLVGRGLIFEDQFVVAGQRVGDRCVQSAWITLLAVFTGVGEHDSLGLLRLEWLCMPNNLVNTVDSSVQGIRSVVLCQLVLHSDQREFTIGETVAVTPNQRAKIRALAEIALQGAEAQGHVAWMTLSIRHD